jgi:hypothetical protein
MLLNDLFEAIKPGERRAIELKIDQYEKAIRDIEQHENELGSYSGLPTLPGTEQELEDLKQSYQSYIDTLREKLRADQEKNKGKGDNFERYMKAIIKNCPTIVKTCKETGKLLYRGTKETAPAFYGKPFDERYAKDSNSEVHQAWNKAMKEAGVVARRDNSIFTTTNRGLASNFGTQVYMVFFRDPFHFTWSDRERDLVLDTSKMADLVGPETVKHVMTAVWANDDLREKYKTKYRNIAYLISDSPVEFDPATYQNDGYGEIFRRNNFQYSYRALIDIIPQLPAEYHKYADFDAWADAETVVANFGIHIDEDLKGAFEQGYEITIRAEYYAIRLDFEDKVRKYLGMGRYSTGSEHY